MSENRHPELEGHESQALYTFELTNQGKSLRKKLLWLLIGLSIGVGTAPLLANEFYDRRAQERRSQPLADDRFHQGSRQAMTAAELTQTAEFREDWSRVAVLWQRALSHMEAVPVSHPSYETAQVKVEEYARNLRYAQSNVDTRAPSDTAQQTYWTLGSNRELVLSIEGMPSRISNYSSSCKTVMHYGNSFVELKNGYVVDFSDQDNNLTVLGDRRAALSMQPSNNTWTLGSSQEEIFQVQGTPTRTSTVQDTITLHYGDSIVQLDRNQVVGYVNATGNLRVSVFPMPGIAPTAPPTWTVGATRMAVLQAEQKTPTAVSRLDQNCEEIFNFEGSTVTFRQGLVSEYTNISNNLQLK